MELSLINFYGEYYILSVKNKNTDRFQIDYCSKRESKIMTRSPMLMVAAEGRRPIKKLATIIHS